MYCKAFRCSQKYFIEKQGNAILNLEKSRFLPASLKSFFITCVTDAEDRSSDY